MFGQTGWTPFVLHPGSSEKRKKRNLLLFHSLSTRVKMLSSKSDLDPVDDLLVSAFLQQESVQLRFQLLWAQAACRHFSWDSFLHEINFLNYERNQIKKPLNSKFWKMNRFYICRRENTCFSCHETLNNVNYRWKELQMITIKTHLTHLWKAEFAIVVVDCRETGPHNSSDGSNNGSWSGQTSLLESSGSNRTSVFDLQEHETFLWCLWTL